MWKRLQKRPEIGAPVLLETTLDESTYGSSSTGFGIRPRPTPNSFNSAESADTINSLPRAPFAEPNLPSPQFPVQNPTSNPRDSKFRPTSSIYSQPTPQFGFPAGDRFPRNSYTNTGGIHYEEDEDEDEVSPPSSPEYQTGPKNTSSRLRYEYTSDSEVSPIDEKMPDISTLEIRPESRPKTPQSNIPTMRREKRRNQIPTPAPTIRPGEYAKNKSPGETRFDKYTGEPTTSDSGGRLGVKPGQFEPPALRSVNNRGNTTSVTANPAPKSQPSFADRFRKLAKPASPTFAQRPEWKGSSGRATLVAPVQDQPDMPPLNIPRKSSRRVASPPISPLEPGVSRNGPQSLTSPSTHSPEPAIVSPYSETSATKSKQSPVTAGRNQKSENTAPATALNPPNLASHKGETSTDAIEHKFREALQNVSNPDSNPPEPYEQPPSRFSISTYAPTTAHSTPRPSYDAVDQNTPPVPTPPTKYDISPPRQNSILNRKRPVGPKGVVDLEQQSPPRPQIARKMVGSSPRDHFNPGSPIFISMREGRRTSTISSTGKALPMSPQEMQSRDLITTLQAQLDNLSHRRMNISKSIRQMTELMPTDHIVLTDEVRRKREIEKAKVEGLREEESDIRQQEHELGLRLHRAYKRRDKDAVYEPTAFWVRRATG